MATSLVVYDYKYEQVEPDATKPFRPAIITPGDEVVWVERNNDNQRWLLQYLYQQGVACDVAISVPDDIDVIAQWVKMTKDAGYYPIFVVGGLGGTHDDCTREGVAKALGRDLVQHEGCHLILSAKYGELGYTVERRRMAMLAHGCGLIKNPIGAPGFFIDGVFALPGFPTMNRPMFTELINILMPESLKSELLIKEYILPVGEAVIATEMEHFYTKYPCVKIGLYPSSEKFGQEVKVRFRCRKNDTQTLTDFEALMANIAKRIGTNTTVVKADTLV
jgi:molybdopterin-biosynthesis enzyme MoeA-like protein